MDRRNLIKSFGAGLVLVSLPKWALAFNPKTWALTVGASSQALLQNNGNRKGLIFYNPNVSGGASVAVCSAYDGGPAGDGVAVINGNGCLTFPPGGVVFVNALPWTGAINGIASAGGTAFTILEFTT